MAGIDEFVQNFYEIQGITLAERTKNFNFLLRDFDRTNLTDEDLVRVDSLIRPRNLLEEIFKLDTFIRFKHIKFLFKIFECENLILIGRLVKCKWLFQESFCDINSDNLMDLFERLSPITRGKIISKLAAYLQDEQLVENYYTTIKRNYGLTTASRLISACSANFIRNEFEQYCFKLKDKQLLRIAKKDLQFVEFYFDKIIKNTHSKSIDANDYLSVFHHIVATDFPLFLSFIDKYNLKMKLNNKLTAKVYNCKKDDVIAKPTRYLEIMNVNKLIRLLKDDFGKFYENSFPKSIKDFSQTTNEPVEGKFSSYAQTFDLINHLQREEKYNMLINTFQKVYKVEIFKYSNFINDYIIEMMPFEERLKWAKQKMTEDRWICYLETKDSIPIIKDKIKLFSDRITRTRYLNYLIETCRINDDKEALLNVLKYYVERHRNEESDTRASFLRKLHNSFKLEELNQEYWTEIMKLSKLFPIQNYFFYEICDINEKYLLYLYENDEINDEAILIYLKDAIRNYCLLTPFDRHLKYRKDFYQRLPELIMNNYKGDELHNVCTTFLSRVKEWNEKNRKDQIDVYSFPQILQVFTNKDNSFAHHYPYNSILPYLFTAKGDTPEKDLIMKEFWSNLTNNSIYLTDILNNILKHEPLSLLEHVEDISQKSRIYYEHFLQKLKYYHHLGLPEKFKEAYLKKLADDENKSDTIRALVYLMPTVDYIKLMAPYTGNETKIDFDNSTFYQNKSAFVESLKYTDTYSLAIPIVQQFCVGDYLKPTLSTLYRIFDYTVVQNTDTLLQELFGRAVSVRKHAIFLTTRSRDEPTIYKTLKELGENEKNPSLIKFIFKRTFKYFCANPSEEFFDLLRLNSRYLKKEDEEAYDYFYQYSNVPLVYLAKFIQVAWDCISESNVDNIKDKRFTLLNQVDDDIIRLLPENFCRNILETYLCNKNEQSVREFACKYILTGESDENLLFICNLLKNFIKTDWQTKSRKIVRSILTHICNSLRQHKKLEYMKTFYGVWHEILEVVNAYEEHLTLKLNVLYLSTNEEYRIRNFAEKVYEFYNENVQTFSNMIIEIFAKVLSDTIESITWDDEYRENHDENLFNFYLGLLNTNKSSFNYALILSLLPKEYSLVYDIKLQHQMILKEISRCEETWLKIRFIEYSDNL